MLPQWYQKPKGIEEGCIIFLFSKNISLGGSNALFPKSFRQKLAENGQFEYLKFLDIFAKKRQKSANKHPHPLITKKSAKARSTTL